MATFAFEAIGTHWRVDVAEEPSPERRAALLRTVLDRVDRFDRSYSRFRGDSLVSDMARLPGAYELPDDAGPILDLYERLYRLTGGAFTPLIGQALVDAGYDAAYSLRPGEVRAVSSWEETMRREGNRLVLAKPALLDFGAGGKGYLADLVADALAAEGIREMMVDAGGDIVFRGGGEHRVGLEDPRDSSRAIGIATVRDGSVCGSGGNVRAWEGFHHVIDPRTRRSPTDVLATWAFAPTGLVADALATVLFLCPQLDAREEFSCESVVFYANGTVRVSSNAPVDLFVA